MVLASLIWYLAISGRFAARSKSSSSSQIRQWVLKPNGDDRVLLSNYWFCWGIAFSLGVGMVRESVYRFVYIITRSSRSAIYTPGGIFIDLLFINLWTRHVSQVVIHEKFDILKKVDNFISGHFWDEEFIAAIRFSQSFQIWAKTEAKMSGFLRRGLILGAENKLKILISWKKSATSL